MQGIMKGNSLRLDFWHEGNSLKDVARADCFFYPNEGVYRGNLYNADGDCIGDYSSTDSVAIEKTFPGIFGD